MTSGRPSPIVVRGRVGVLGDIHAEAARVERALRVFEREGVERVLATGDIADGAGDASEVDRACASLERASALTVIGNHDRWLLDGELRDLPDATPHGEVSAATCAYLRGLPATIELSTPLGPLLLCHGVGPNDMSALYPHDRGPALDANVELQALLREGRYKLLVGGHTHRRMVRVIAGLTVINAGTLVPKREPCCALIDFEARRVRFIELPTDAAERPGPEHPI